MVAAVKGGLSGGLGVLLGGVGLFHVADYLIIPVLPVVLRADRGFAPGQVGVVLSAASILFLTGSLVGGGLADRLGRRSVMVAGATLRVLGLAGLGTFSTMYPVVLSAAVGGLGSGFFAPALKAAIAALASTPDARTTAFSWRGVAANAGVALAGVAALALARVGSGLLFYLAAAIYLTLALLTWRLLPRECEAQVGGELCPRIAPGRVRNVLRNWPFLGFSAAGFLLWALYAQLALALPLRATMVLANPRTVSLIWTVNSIIVILTQAAVTRLVIRRLHPLTAMAAGALLLGTGIAGLGWGTQLWQLAVAASVFVAGEMLILPTFDSTVSQLAPAGQAGMFFGLANFVSGLGESAGNLFGGRLLDPVRGPQAPWPWPAYLAFAGVAGGAVWLVRHWQPLRMTLRRAAASPGGPLAAPGAGITDLESQPAAGEPADEPLRT